eukprot:TRINITY_DN23665_c0_g1_i1.p1 TRINITY_DN23665_c0_g1~~TRINITY_DN23665_c0_g1_i1.p1  ORF type:complete len:564 (+),score=72.32 TRINITY_DN23665_c0_g1_i1:88-1779(+)
MVVLRICSMAGEEHEIDFRFTPSEDLCAGSANVSLNTLRRRIGKRLFGTEVPPSVVQLMVDGAVVPGCGIKFQKRGQHLTERSVTLHELGINIEEAFAGKVEQHTNITALVAEPGQFGDLITSPATFWRSMKPELVEGYLFHHRETPAKAQASKASSVAEPAPSVQQQQQQQQSPFYSVESLADLLESVPERPLLRGVVCEHPTERVAVLFKAVDAELIRKLSQRFPPSPHSADPEHGWLRAPNAATLQDSQQRALTRTLRCRLRSETAPEPLRPLAQQSTPFLHGPPSDSDSSENDKPLHENDDAEAHEASPHSTSLEAIAELLQVLRRRANGFERVGFEHVHLHKPCRRFFQGLLAALFQFIAEYRLFFESIDWCSDDDDEEEDEEEEDYLGRPDSDDDSELRNETDPSKRREIRLRQRREAKARRAGERKTASDLRDLLHSCFSFDDDWAAQQALQDLGEDAVPGLQFLIECTEQSKRKHRRSLEQLRFRFNNVARKARRLRESSLRGCSDALSDEEELEPVSDAPDAAFDIFGSGFNSFDAGYVMQRLIRQEAKRRRTN